MTDSKRNILWGIIGSYATFYCTRNNLEFVINQIKLDSLLNESQLGLIGGIFPLAYGLGKFFLGAIGDLVSPRKMLITGLLGIAFCNFLLIFWHNYWGLGLLLFCSGVFQSMGWPPCTKLLVFWFQPAERKTKWALSCTSMQIGNITASLIAYLFTPLWGWKVVLLLPGLIAILTIPWVLLLIEDPKCEITDQKTLVNNWSQAVFSPGLWIFALANFFFSAVRYGVSFWLAYILINYEAKSLAQSGLAIFIKELGALLGGLMAGYLGNTKQGSIIAARYTLILVLAFFYAYYWERQDSFFLFILGLAIQGPHVLSGVVATEFVDNKVAGFAVGLVGVAGYLGSALCSLLTGMLLKQMALPVALLLWLSFSVLACLGFYVSSLFEKKTRLN